MIFSSLILFVHVLIFQSAVQEVLTDPIRERQSASNRSLNLLINSRKLEDGEWLTTFHASKSDSKTNNISLDLTQIVYQRDDGQTLHIKGFLRANRDEGNTDRLTFHPACGTNAAISDDERSVQKINLDDQHNGVALTNRPLRRNELFEVRLDEKINKFNYCFGIGVTTHNPESLKFPEHMNLIKSGIWMMYHDAAFVNGTLYVKKYGKNLNHLQVGDRVGVMVNNYGTLKFFVNGVDQGPATSNMPLRVYGVIELYKNAVKGTIID